MVGWVVFSFQGQNGSWNDPKIVNGVFGHWENFDLTARTLEGSSMLSQAK